MARLIRYYGKKRGHRRTGSPTLGGVGEAAFFAAFLLLGVGGFAWLFSTFVLPEWRVNHEFVPSTCKVLDKSIIEKPDKEGTLYGPVLKIEYSVADAKGPVQAESHYDVHEAYSSSQDGAKAILDKFQIYTARNKCVYPCWYDPADTRLVVLTQGYGWWIWLWFTVPVSFIVIGAGGLIYALLRLGKSVERRAAIARRARGRRFLQPADGAASYPFVPQGADMTNSPGTKLKFRLPMAGAAGWALFGMLMFCLAWNGAVGVLLVVAIRGHVAGHADWPLTLFVIPFLAAGLWAIVHFLRRLFVAAGIGPTRLEISDHPLRPGRTYQLFLSQSGRLRMKTLRVSLVCEEVATYRQGTNARSETREVYRHELFRQDDFEVSGQPFETGIAMSVPKGAMHSFSAAHNDITWTLVVEGEAIGWRNYRRPFSVMVHPAGEGAP
ncbi:MAG: hypothetical protein ABFC63_02460 [Thermoguttaceae bacterium]